MDVRKAVRAGHCASIYKTLLLLLLLKLSGSKRCDEELEMTQPRRAGAAPPRSGPRRAGVAPPRSGSRRAGAAPPRSSPRRAGAAASPLTAASPRC